MSTGKQVAHRIHALKGTVKVAIGRVTGNRRLRASGYRDKATSNARLFGAKIKEAIKR